MSDGQLIDAEKLCALTGLTDRRHRQLAKAGYFPPPYRSQYQYVPTLVGIFRYYRERAETVAAKRAAVVDEEFRKRKRENDEAEGLLIKRADVVAEFRLQFNPIQKVLRQKLENEYPTAVAGMDVPQARIYGKRLGDEVMKGWEALFKAMKI